ncbi:hypothetical protein FPQ18DRAFT_304191 [Pyronema domesticum]|nr:hypothetical protein FPQ18DRAFT_304191 [Pyronema domesticum]
MQHNREEQDHREEEDSEEEADSNEEADSDDEDDSDDDEDDSEDEERRVGDLLAPGRQAIIADAIAAYHRMYYDKIPARTSILTGAMRTQEVLMNPNERVQKKSCVCHLQLSTPFVLGSESSNYWMTPNI